MPLRSCAVQAAVILACPLAWASSGRAAEIEARTYAQGETAIFVFGGIEKGDDQKFTEVAAQTPKATVVLSSDGGSVGAAIEIGKAIRLKGYSTLVMNGSNCSSSCALIWLAGSPRRISKSAKIGFHASYVYTNNRQETSGVGNAIVGRYLTLLNLPENAVVFATMAKPDSITWLTPDNYQETGIDLVVDRDYYSKSESKTDSTASMPSKPAPTVEEWAKVGPWTLRVDLTLNRGCFAVGTYPSGFVFRVGFQNANTTDGYILFGDKAWASLTENQEYKLSLKFGQNGAWDLPATAVKIGSTNLLKSTFSDTAFWKEFAESTTISLNYKGRSVANVSIDQTSAVLDSLVECQKTQHKIAAKNDPFAN